MSPQLRRQKISGEGTEEENHDFRTPCASCPHIDTEQFYRHLWSVKQLLASHSPTQTTVETLLWQPQCLCSSSAPLAWCWAEDPILQPEWAAAAFLCHPPAHGKRISYPVHRQGGKRNRKEALIDGRLQKWEKMEIKWAKNTCWVARINSWWKFASPVNGKWASNTPPCFLPAIPRFSDSLLIALSTSTWTLADPMVNMKLWKWVCNTVSIVKTAEKWGFSMLHVNSDVNKSYPLS